MKKLAALAVSMCALLGASGSVSAGPMQSMTSEGWRSMCRYAGSQRVAVQTSDVRCRARLNGEIDGILVGMRLSRTKPWICMPPRVDAEVRREVVEKYLSDHPEALSEDFGEGVAAALAHAYPCHR